MRPFDISIAPQNCAAGPFAASTSICTSPAVPRADDIRAFCTPDTLFTFAKPFSSGPFSGVPATPLKKRSFSRAHLAPVRAKRGHRPKHCRWKDRTLQDRLGYAAKAASLATTKPSLFVTINHDQTGESPSAFVRKMQRHLPSVVGFGVHQRHHGHYTLCIPLGSPAYHHFQSWLCHRYNITPLQLWQKKSCKAANVAKIGFLPRRANYMRRHLDEAGHFDNDAGVIFIGGLRKKAIALADSDYKEARPARRRVRDKLPRLAPIPLAPPVIHDPEVAAMFDRDKDMLLRVILRRLAEGEALQEAVHRVVAAWPTAVARAGPTRAVTTLPTGLGFSS